MNMSCVRGWRAPSRIALVALAMFLAGCAASTPSDDDDGFPDIESNWYEGGKFIDPDAVLRVSSGQSKDQVRQLLDNPHFDEGFFGVREWDYVFNFYTGNGREYITCQYKVLFDDDMHVESTRWRHPQCPALLVPIQVEESGDEGERVQSLTLDSDVLFEFDSDRLELEGRRALDRVVAILEKDFSQPVLTVQGHTDRLGDDAYNLALSRSRAGAVKAYLVNRGIDAATISSQGMGDAEPVVECAGNRVTPVLKECLQPNRRVDIEVKENV